jgi:hypothetical protein
MHTAHCPVSHGLSTRPLRRRRRPQPSLLVATPSHLPQRHAPATAAQQGPTASPICCPLSARAGTVGAAAAPARRHRSPVAALSVGRWRRPPHFRTAQPQRPHPRTHTPARALAATGRSRPARPARGTKACKAWLCEGHTRRAGARVRAFPQIIACTVECIVLMILIVSQQGDACWAEGMARTAWHAPGLAAPPQPHLACRPRQCLRLLRRRQRARLALPASRETGTGTPACSDFNPVRPAMGSTTAHAPTAALASRGRTPRTHAASLGAFSYAARGPATHAAERTATTMWYTASAAEGRSGSRPAGAGAGPPPPLMRCRTRAWRRAGGRGEGR